MKRKLGVELERYIRRKLPNVSKVKWRKSSNHTHLFVESDDGKEVHLQVSSTPSDHRARMNITARVKNRLDQIDEIAET